MASPPYEDIAEGLKAGSMVPFFGAAASAVYRPKGATWRPGQPFMPFGGELARNIAQRFSYAQQTPQPLNLALVASWVEHCQATRPRLYSQLRRSFLVDCEPGELHTSLSELENQRLFVTTNYDDLLEKALAARRPFTITDRGHKGVWLQAFGKPPMRVDPNGGDLFDHIEDRTSCAPAHPIVFKMHGSLVREDSEQDHFLITEEDYTDFLSKGADSYLPPYIHSQLSRRTLLFLGYSLEDWNVRVLIRKLLPFAMDELRFYAIVQGHSEPELELWQAKSLNIYSVDLLEFSDRLLEELKK